MKTYTMTVFAGSTMLTHETSTMYGVINALRDVSLKIHEYASLLEMGAIDEYIEDLVLMKRSEEPVRIFNKTPFIRITMVEDETSPIKEGSEAEDGNVALAV